MLRRYLPILGWLPGYRRAWIKDDAVAALSVWALLVPQGLAYATIAGVPVQYGLYTAFAALIAYALFGTARQVVQGPSATVAAVSTAVISPLVGASALGTDKAAEWAAALALAAAALYLGLGLLRMGWVSNFLSKAVLGGFILGFAIGIVIDQTPNLLGVSVDEDTYFEDLIDLIGKLGDTDLATLAVGAASLGLLLAMRYLRPKWPRALVVVALATAAAAVFDLGEEGVALTGKVPTGLFDVGLPGVGWSEAGTLVVGALSVIFVGYSETLAAGRLVSSKHGYEIDPDQELIAQGAASGAAGFVGGFVNDGSLSKSSVADTAGQRSQMASLINAAMVLLTLLFLASLFDDLPAATLGAVVMDAMVGLISFAGMKRYYGVNRPDWVFFMGAMVGILFFGIIAGIVIGVVLSLLLLIARASNPGIRLLGRHPDSDAYLDVDRHEGLIQSPGVVVVRVDGPLFFADANRFRDRVRELVDAGAPVHAVVIDAEAVSQTDTDGADILIELASELESKGATLVLARVQSSILDLWRRAGAIDAIGSERVFHTTAEAVEQVSSEGGASRITRSG
jgi:high affinity sulfate transporter 1